MDVDLYAVEDGFHVSKTYRKILEHRGACEKWKKKEFCLECFGGGLNRTLRAYAKEMRREPEIGHCRFCGVSSNEKPLYPYLHEGERRFFCVKCYHEKFDLKEEREKNDKEA